MDLGSQGEVSLPKGYLTDLRLNSHQRTISSTRPSQPLSEVFYSTQEASAVDKSSFQSPVFCGCHSHQLFPVQIYPLFSAGVELICFSPEGRHVFSRISHSFAISYQLLLEPDQSPKVLLKETAKQDSQERTTSACLPQQTKLVVRLLFKIVKELNL